MCTNGINIDQLRQQITAAEESLGLAQHWLEDLHHLADSGHQHEASTEVAQVTVLLGEAREKLERACDSLGSEGSNGEVTVEVV